MVGITIIIERLDFLKVVGWMPSFGPPRLRSIGPGTYIGPNHNTRQIGVIATKYHASLFHQQSSKQPKRWSQQAVAIHAP